MVRDIHMNHLIARDEDYADRINNIRREMESDCKHQGKCREKDARHYALIVPPVPNPPLACRAKMCRPSE